MTAALLGLLEQVLGQAADEWLELRHHAQDLSGFGCVLWRVVDALIRHAVTVKKKKNQLMSIQQDKQQPQ